MCGVVGIVGKSDVNLQLYDALTMLQHRGQDAAGMVTCEEGRIAQQKANASVANIQGMNSKVSTGQAKINAAQQRLDAAKAVTGKDALSPEVIAQKQGKIDAAKQKLSIMWNHVILSNLMLLGDLLKLLIVSKGSICVMVGEPTWF